MSTLAVRLVAPQATYSSALHAKLATFFPLSDAEASALEECENSPRHFGRRKIIRRQGEASTDLFIMRAGWAFSFAIMPDGGRQILDFHFPGDIIGMSSIAFDTSVSGIASITPVDLCPVSRDHFAKVANATPRLAMLVNAMMTVENVILIDRLKSIGRMEARDRLALFYLQILSRLEIEDPRSRDSFHLPMSQELVGDALGLSAIHTNRTLKRLETEGHLFREHQRVTLLQRSKLAESVDFTNRYDQLTTHWLPE